MIRFAQVSLLLALSLAGCGGGSGGSSAGSSGVTGTKSAATLSDADKGTICDWYVAMIGGYGAPTTCDQASLKAPTSKTDCVTSFPTCDTTVSNFEDCVKAIVAAQMTCTEAALDDAFSTAACKAATCFMQN